MVTKSKQWLTLCSQHQTRADVQKDRDWLLVIGDCLQSPLPINPAALSHQWSPEGSITPGCPGSHWCTRWSGKQKDQFPVGPLYRSTAHQAGSSPTDWPVIHETVDQPTPTKQLLVGLAIVVAVVIVVVVAVVVVFVLWGRDNWHQSQFEFNQRTNVDKH